MAPYLDSSPFLCMKEETVCRTDIIIYNSIFHRYSVISIKALAIYRTMIVCYNELYTLFYHQRITSRQGYIYHSSMTVHVCLDRCQTEIPKKKICYNYSE